MPPRTDPDAAPPPPAAPWRIGLVAAVWLGLAEGLGPVALKVLPRSILGELTLETFGMLVQVVMTLAGIGISLALLPSLRHGLGLWRPSAKGVAATALLAPLIWV